MTLLLRKVVIKYKEREAKLRVGRRRTTAPPPRSLMDHLLGVGGL